MLSAYNENKITKICFQGLITNPTEKFPLYGIKEAASTGVGLMLTLTLWLTEVVFTSLVMFLPDQEILQLLDTVQKVGVVRAPPDRKVIIEYLIVLSIVLSLSSSSETWSHDSIT